MAQTKNLFFPTKTVTDGLPFSSVIFSSVSRKWVGVLMREYYEAVAGLRESMQRVNEEPPVWRKKVKHGWRGIL